MKVSGADFITHDEARRRWVDADKARLVLGPDGVVERLDPLKRLGLIDTRAVVIRRPRGHDQLSGRADGDGRRRRGAREPDYQRGRGGQRAADE